MLEVRRVLSADNTDVLDGTVLGNIPGPGQIDIWHASSQNDTTLQVTTPDGMVPIKAQRLDQRTNGMVVMSDQTPISIAATQGGHPIVEIDIVTAATVQLIIQYRGLEDLE